MAGPGFTTTGFTSTGFTTSATVQSDGVPHAFDIFLSARSKTSYLR